MEKIREKIVNRKYNFELLIRIQRKCTNAQQIDKSSQYYNNSNNKMNEKNKRTKKKQKQMAKMKRKMGIISVLMRANFADKNVNEQRWSCYR